MFILNFKMCSHGIRQVGFNGGGGGGEGRFNMDCKK